MRETIEKRECIKAVKYTYKTTKGQRFKRIVLCELEPVKEPDYEWFKNHMMKKKTRIFTEK